MFDPNKQKYIYIQNLLNLNSSDDNISNLHLVSKLDITTNYILTMILSYQLLY